MFVLNIALLGEKDNIPLEKYTANKYTTCKKISFVFYVVNSVNQIDDLYRKNDDNTYMCYNTEFCKDQTLIEYAKSKNIEVWDGFRYELPYIFAQEQNKNMAMVTTINVPQKYYNALIVEAIKNNDVEFLTYYNSLQNCKIPHLLRAFEYLILSPYVIALRHKAIDAFKYLIEVNLPIISSDDINELIYLLHNYNKDVWDICIPLLISSCDFVIEVHSLCYDNNNYTIWLINNCKKIIRVTYCLYTIHTKLQNSEITRTLISKIDHVPTKITAPDDKCEFIKQFCAEYAPFITIVKQSVAEQSVAEQSVAEHS